MNHNLYSLSLKGHRDPKVIGIYIFYDKRRVETDTKVEHFVKLKTISLLQMFYIAPIKIQIDNVLRVDAHCPLQSLGPPSHSLSYLVRRAGCFIFTGSCVIL